MGKARNVHEGYLQREREPWVCSEGSYTLMKRANKIFYVVIRILEIKCNILIYENR